MKKRLCAFAVLLTVLTIAFNAGIASGESMIQQDRMYNVYWTGKMDSLPSFSPVKHGITIHNGIYLIMPMKMYLTFNSDKTITWTYDYYEVKDTEMETYYMYRIPKNGNVFLRQSEQYVIDGNPVYWSTEDDDEGFHALYMYIKNEEDNTNVLVGMFGLEKDYNGIFANLYTTEKIHDGQYYFRETW